MKLSRWSCVAHSTVRNLLGSTHFFPSEAYRWPAPSWSFWVSVSCNGINWTQWGLLFASFLVWVSFNWINGPSEAVVRTELWVGYSSFTRKSAPHLSRHPLIWKHKHFNDLSRHPGVWKNSVFLWLKSAYRVEKIVLFTMFLLTFHAARKIVYFHT